MKEALINSQVYILKTTAATILAIIVAKILGIEDTLSASFVAMLCVKPTFYTGLKVGKSQFIASFWGVVITGTLILLLGNSITVNTISLIIVISLCVFRGMNEYIPVAGFTVLYMFLVNHETVEGIFVRMAAVFIGVAVASLINLLLSFVRYKNFFYFRVKYASNIVYNAFEETIEANKNADIKKLNSLYNTYENIYSQLSNFSSELSDINKELKVRKNAGGISIDNISNIYRIIENLKMCVRYLQDIVFISEVLAPEHQNIPNDWKIKIDEFWNIEQEKFKSILSNINNNQINNSSITGIYDINFINELILKTKEDNSKKELYTRIMSIFTDFQQLHFTLNNLDYFICEYNQSQLKEKQLSKV